MKKHGILTAALCCLMSLCSGISAQAEEKFTDVSSDSPYHDAIYWALDNGVTTGKTETTFAPDMGCTRAQFVTFLWRSKGEPEPTKYVSFNDMVAPASPFYKAIQWAAEEGITQGYAGNLFKPSEVCSRGSALTFLYRAAGEPTVSAQNISFTDMVPASHAYYNGIVWGVENGITLGYSDGTFKPFRACSRGQNVTFLYRAKDQLFLNTPETTPVPSTPAPAPTPEAHDHQWDEGIITKEPTCTETGVKTYTCQYPGCYATQTETIPATGEHKWIETSETVQAYHAFCNACGKDFGPGDAGVDAVGMHVMLADPSSPCYGSNYHSENRPTQKITRKCAYCDKTEVLYK